MTDQQMHERLRAAGARWREQEAAPTVSDFEPPQRQRPPITGRRVTWLLTAAAVIAAAVGIAMPLLVGGARSQPPAGNPAQLYGVRCTWAGSSLSGPKYRLPPSFDLVSTPYLRFASGGRVTGNDGCNSLAGSVQVRGNRLTFGSLGGTFALCRGPMGKISDGIDRTLHGQATWRIVCDTLMITNRNGNEVGYEAAGRPPADVRCLRRWSDHHAVK